MKTYLRILSYTKPYKKFLPLYAFLVLVHVLFDIFSFTLLIPLLDIIFDQSTSILPLSPIGIEVIDIAKDYFNNQFLSVVSKHGKIGALAFVCIALVSMNFLTNFFYYLSQRIIGEKRSKLIVSIRKHLFDKIHRLHVGYFTNEKRGDLISRITNDIQEIERTIVGSVRVVFRDPFKIVMIFIYLFFKEAKLTLFCLAIMPFAAICITLISKNLRKLADNSQSILGNILEIVNESIGAIRVVKTFNNNNFVTDKFDYSNNHYGNLLKKMAFKRDLASPLSQFVSICFVGMILFYGGYLVLSNNNDIGLSPSEFLAFIIIFARILDPAKALAAAISEIQRGVVAGRRIFEIIDLEDQIKDKDNALSIHYFKKSIQFQNFSFAYEEEFILNGIDLEIKKGKSIALVGHSGAGKSTIMDMMLRFYDPQKGKLLIDNIDIRDLKLGDIRSLIGLVSQDAILLNDTIRNNITFGTDYTEEEIINATKLANAYSFICDQIDGFDTIIGDRGIKLSGGQRQRITIARTVLRQPAILLLDEATSALDSESEKLVQKAITQLMKGRTSIIIAHRLSTIKHVDEIVVLEKGKIVEQGSHDELLTQKGVYYRMHSIQN